MANRVVTVNVPKIRELAKMKGLTLTELESVACIAHGTTGKWITSGGAHIDKLYRVADVLGTSIDELLQKV